MSTVCRDTQLPGFSSFWSCSFIWCRPLMTVQTTFPGLLRHACSLDMPISWKNVCVCVCVCVFLGGGHFSSTRSGRLKASDHIWRYHLRCRNRLRPFVPLTRKRANLVHPRQPSDQNGKQTSLFWGHLSLQDRVSWTQLVISEVGTCVGRTAFTRLFAGGATMVHPATFFWAKFWMSHLQICRLL